LDPVQEEPTETTPGTTPEPEAAPAAGTTFGADWPKKAADAVDTAVDVVRDKVVRPIIVAARGVVFGLLILVLFVTFMTLFSVAFIRLLDVYVFHGHVWASYTLVGLVFCIAGAWAWTKRAPKVTE
jgi:hypothetical protein